MTSFLFALEAKGILLKVKNYQPLIYGMEIWIEIFQRSCPHVHLISDFTVLLAICTFLTCF